MKRSRSLLVLAVALLASSAMGPASAAGAAPRGRLTQNEYLRLERWLAASSRASAGRQSEWNAARGACLGLGQSTALLAATRASCLATVGEAQAWVATSTAAQRCGPSTPTTTTGIAAAVGDGPELKQLVCMNSSYQSLARAVAALAAADRALRESGVARRFTGHCLVTLVPTRQQLATEDTYLEAADRLAAGLELYVKVQRRQAPRSSIGGQTVLDDAVAVTPARDRWLGAAIAYPLSVCPHG